MEIECCYLEPSGKSGCSSAAEWQLEGVRPDDVTYACAEHVGDLLGDAPIYVLSPIGRTNE